MDPTRAAAILEAMGIQLPAQIVDANGNPISSETQGPLFGVTETRKPCPNCSAPPKRRVRSGGFGKNHDLCGECGHAFDELTVEGTGR